MILIIDWIEFQEQIVNLQIEGNEIAKKESATIRDEKTFDSIKVQINDWVKKCYEYLSESFDDEKKEFANSFRQRQTPSFHVPGVRKNVMQEIKNEFSELKSKIKTLDYYLRLLSVSDAIIKPNETDLEIRKKYLTEEIMELLLDKLYDLYDNSYYPVEAILEGNGIELSRHGEDRQIVNRLCDLGLVNSTKTRFVDAQLTLDGKIYVEDKRNQVQVSYEGISNSKEEISDKIDELKEELNKLGLGQEILFEELEDLKELYGQINKKNWGQLLKGKLIDLGLAQIINKDTMKLVYEFVTNDILKLT
nr:hypothetical protein [uncultured Draconibacterium sp.]